MLTGKMVRVRYVRQQLVPYYLDTRDPEWLETAERLLLMYRSRSGGTRGELEAEIDETFGDSPHQLVHQGLAKLLEDRCDFAVVSSQPPEEIRAAVFRSAALLRQQRKMPVFSPSPPTPLPGVPGKGEEEGSSHSGTPGREEEEGSLHSGTPGRGAGGEGPDKRPSHFDRAAVLQQVSQELNLSAEEIERGLFADLRSEQQLITFKDTTAERLLQRYNVALAQAVLMRAAAVEIRIRGEPPQRYRQLLRLSKFHRLMCDIEASGEDTYRLRLDGPLSLFSATQKYGLQLALFLPAVLNCKQFELQAEVRWGPQRTPKKFVLTPKDGLVSHHVDTGMYVPPELAMFVELFRKKIADWEISEQTDILPLGSSFWVPDYQLIHRHSGQVLYLEVLGFWRRSSLEQHLARLRQHMPAPFVLAVSEQLHVEDAELEGLPASILRFRQLPLPKDVAEAANQLLRK